MIRKIASIPDDRTVAELNPLLRKAQVFISWWGQRMVSIQGYEATTVNALAQKFLKATIFKRLFSATKEEKVDCYFLWGQIKTLYENSDDAMQKTWVFQCLTYRPYRKSWPGVEAIIRRWTIIGPDIHLRKVMEDIAEEHNPYRIL
jgi:hypothetical protein